MKFSLCIETKTNKDCGLDIVLNYDFVSRYTSSVKIYTQDKKQIRANRNAYENMDYLISLVNASGVEGYEIDCITPLVNEIDQLSQTFDEYCGYGYTEKRYGFDSDDFLEEILENAMVKYTNAYEYVKKGDDSLEKLFAINEELELYEDLAENEQFDNGEWIDENMNEDC